MAETGAQQQKRRKKQGYYDTPYWKGFILRQAGQCEEAILQLKPLAIRGQGYENAQLALGLCLMEMAGLPTAATPPPARATMFAKAQFREGLAWVTQAANAGAFSAQAAMLALYAANLGPDRNAQQAAMWVHLYLTNPMRLHLGAPVDATATIQQLKKTISQKDWLAGKELARLWVPHYTEPMLDHVQNKPVITDGISVNRIQIPRLAP
ncbi:MAG: hypothetical protein OXU76_04185 [Alphaproteobacteria bacterium]|nr:hypothetical protein [Alphaproteobacteria bacterium]